MIACNLTVTAVTGKQADSSSADDCHTSAADDCQKGGLRRSGQQLTLEGRLEAERWPQQLEHAPPPSSSHHNTCLVPLAQQKPP